MDRRGWIVAFIVYAALLLGTLTLARSATRWANERIGAEGVRGAVVGVYVWLGVGAAVSLRRMHMRPMGWGLLAVGAALTGLVLSRIPQPEEQIHLLEYSILAVLAGKALSPSAGEPRNLAALLLASAIGVLDELIQGILPQRIFDVRDILFNAFGSGLGISWTVIRARFARKD